MLHDLVTLSLICKVGRTRPMPVLEGFPVGALHLLMGPIIVLGAGEPSRKRALGTETGPQVSYSPGSPGTNEFPGQER